MSDCELDFTVDEPVKEKVVQFGEFEIKASSEIPKGWVSFGTTGTYTVSGSTTSTWPIVFYGNSP